ncbi:MAG TPA: hypothetical protein VD761_04090 [Solirubrobacterales bacterium]|nr:hypothetical protein [Solirubrobacterales bacterium]
MLLPLLVAAIALGASGCGEEGAEEGATLNVYVSAPLQGAEGQQGRQLCDEAREQAAKGRGDEDFELRVICLDASGPEGDWTLAKVGSNARKATEDSASIAYIGEPTRAARKQSQPIIEAAEIAAMGSRNGKEAIKAITAVLEEDDSDDPRATVFDAIEG